MQFFRRRRINPHIKRTRTLQTMQVISDPAGALKEAIWYLILGNCFPEERSTSTRFNQQKRRAKPITDVLVQTFYVVYPSSRFDLVETLGVVDETRLTNQILTEMVNYPGEIFDPYLSDRIGEANWAQAKATGTADQINYARINRIVDIIKMPLNEPPNMPVRVVGRESLAVEVSRLKERTGDPIVLASVSVGGSAYVNPHLREYSTNAAERRKRGFRLCILGGRDSRQYIIGPNTYDDIEVPGMPDSDWYLLTVSSPPYRGITTRLADSSGKEIMPNPDNLDPEHTWNLKRRNNSKELYFCKLTFTSHGDTPLSQYVGAPEVPPRVVMLGRVLPQTTRNIPEELRNILLPHNVKLISAIELDERLFLYACEENQSKEIYLLNRDPNRNVDVINTPNTSPKGFRLTNDSDVNINTIRYKWRAHHIGVVPLPTGIAGALEHTSPNLVAYIEPPMGKSDPNKWMLGYWRYGGNIAEGEGCKPIIPENPDRYLSQFGNLIIRENGRDRQGHPQYQLILRDSGEEIPFFARDHSRRGPVWITVPWSDFFKGERQKEIGNLNLVSTENYLIIGSGCYQIITSGTKT